MAGYWATRWEFNDQTGQKTQVRYWVETKAPVVSSQIAAAQAAARETARRVAAQQARARAIALAKRNADLAAQRAAEARQRILGESGASRAAEQAQIRQQRDANIARARREAYERLQAQTKSLINYKSARDEDIADRAAQRKQMTLNQQKAASDASKKAAYDAQMEAQKRLLLQKQGRESEFRHGRGQGYGKEWAPQDLTGDDVIELEKVIAWEAENGKKGQFHVDDVDALRTLYDKYAGKVYDKYEEAVSKVNEAIDKYNKTHKSSDLAKARALYNEYMKTKPEFERLFGDGTNPLKDGAYNQMVQNYQQIDIQQREWWKRQMKASLQSTIDAAQDKMDRDQPEYQSAREMLAWLNGSTDGLRKIADGVDPKTRKTKYRYATPEEELAYREAERIAKMEKMRAAYEAFKVKEKVQMMREGYVEYKGQFVERQMVPAITQAEETMQKYYGGKFEPTRPNDIHNFVDKMLSDWKIKNPEPPNGGRGNPEATLKKQQWMAARQAAENQFYQFFGLGPQGILEKGIDTPGIRHALTLLGTPFAAIGAGGRVLNAAVFGENTIGGVKPTSADIPENIRKRLEAEAKAALPGAANAPRGAQAIAIKTNQLIREWMASPAGQQWYNEEYQRRRVEDAQEGTQFAKDFYGHDPNKDWLQGFEALNQYGNEPFQNAGANLLASLALDPLNAIPLNFLKYYNRGRFALETAKGFTGTGKLLGKTKGYKFLSTFRSVDEGTLSLWKHMGSLEKEILAKGISRDEFLGLLRERVLGVTEKSAKEVAIRGLFRELGLSPRKVNEAQLFSLAERLIHVKAIDNGRTLWTQADEAAKAIKQADAERALKAQERAARRRAEQQRVNDEAAKVKAEAEGARALQGVAKKAEEQRLAKIVADEKAAAGKQAGTAGKAAGPTSPVQTHRVKLTAFTRYADKDQLKADRATKFIGRGSARSASAQYAKDFGDLANTGSYKSSDTVFVSVEGNRSGRLSFDKNEVDLAIAARAKIVTDDLANRSRPYNVGERELAAHLSAAGYVESAPGHWTAPKVPQNHKGLAVKPLVQKEGGEAIGAAYNKADKTIHVDDVVLEKKYSEKAWTTPRELKDGTRAAPLPDDAFKSYDEFRAFALEHEYQHSLLSRKAGETLGEYETRINNAALGNALTTPAARAAHAAAEVRKADDARTPISGVDQVAVDFEAIVDEIKSLAPQLAAETRAARAVRPVSAFRPIRDRISSLIYRMVDAGWQGASPEALKQMDALVWNDEIASLLKSVRKQAGDIVRAERLKVSKVTPEAVVDGLATAPLSMSEIILNRIFKMSEPEWYAYRKEILHKGLTLKGASAEAKAAARKEIAQIELAEKALLIEKNRGTHVRWQDRAKFQTSVLKSHWKDAKGRIAPKMIAPLVRKAADVGVEQARMYYSAIRRASPNILPSDITLRIGGKEVDHLPLRIYRELDALMSEAISKARGHTADTVTKTRRAAGELEDSTRPLGAMTDKDPIVVAAKERVLKDYARRTGNVIPMSAYDEARMVLWKGHTQAMSAERLLAEAEAVVARFGGDIEVVYSRLRQKWADQEARRQLGGLAFGEMYGFDPEVVWGEFLARYSDDGTIRQFAPEMTSFQRRTLEEGYHELSGLTIDDAATPRFLQSVNGPPFHEGQGATRDFLKRIGVWSPRTTEDFILGSKSWSVFDEEAHWLSQYGEAPPWTTVKQLEGEFNDIFDDQAKYIEFHKQQGVFSRSKELGLRIDGADARKIEEAHFKGDAELGIKARRSLDDQRRYAIERFGRLVSKDGVTLDRMPWLMHPDELRRYMTKTTAKRMPEGFIRNARELEIVEVLIDRAMDKFWKKYMEKGLDDAAPILQEDVFRLASEIQAQLLADPMWSKRIRDIFGDGLDAWASFNRWLTFSNPSFMITNVIDAPVKSLWYRFSRRGLFQRTLDNSRWVDDAEALTPEMLGDTFASTPAIYREKGKRFSQRLPKTSGTTRAERAIDRVLGVGADLVVGQQFPKMAGRAEQAMKMRLAKGMWPQVYDTMLKRFKDPDLARAASLDFVGKEISKMWPTAGSGPIEQLWNRFVPFGSYTLRNKVLWISEAIDHPQVLNQFDRIGRYLEEENLRAWEEDPEHKGQPMPENLRRLIELPWAKGYFIDLGQFSDASRGLAPLYDTNWKSNLTRFNEWIRVINPSMLAGFLALANAYNFAQRTAFERVLDSKGFPTGQWREVTVPWTEPWSKEQANFGSMFWFIDAIQTGQKYGIDGWDQGESSAMVGQVFLFNAIKTYDKLGVTYGWYKGLSKADKAEFLKTPEGLKLMEWLRDKMSQPKGFNLTLTEMMQQHDADPRAWWNSQPAEFKDRVNAARDKISLIRDTFAANMFLLQPGTEEYKQMKARMYLAISDVYTQYPELLSAEVYSKSASEWAAQTSKWQTDALIDTFMAMSKQRPQRAAYATTAAYNKAVEDWEHAKKVFLNTYPQVAKAMAGEISAVSTVRAQIEKQWDTVLTRISKRTDAINEAKAIIKAHGKDSKSGREAQARIDLLYLQNDLDYSLLERDYAAFYLTADDYKRMTGDFGSKTPLLKRATSFLDFDATIYQKHAREGTLEDYLAKAQYGQMMKAATLYAKGGDPFGTFSVAKWMKYMQDNPVVANKYFGNDPKKRDAFAKAAAYVEGLRSIWAKAGDDPAMFVKLLKKNPTLLAEYFKRNPGKQAEWARMDSYIRHISVWGKLVGAERWDEANAAWDRLPQWVKDEYYKKHPEKRKRAQQTAQYLGFMEKWVKLVKEDEAKGMEYFRSLPKWAQDRYFAKHPENRLKFEANEEMNSLIAGYFATDESARAEYLAKNPKMKAWLAKNAGNEQAQRLAILQAYKAIPKEDAWLRRVFREKYPEIFSAEAKGEQKLKSIYATLSDHPAIIGGFEKWVQTIWDTYAEMLRLGTPRPAKLYFERDRAGEAAARARMASRSAADVSAS